MLFTLTACITGNVVREDTIKLGGVYGLTGIVADWGQGELEATVLAIEEINEKGGVNGKRISLVVEDMKSSQTGVLTSTRKLITVDNVDAIIGPSWLETYASAASLSDEHDIIMVTPSTAIGALERDIDFKNIFSTLHSGRDQFRELLRYMATQEVDEIVLLYAQEPYWMDIMAHVKKDVILYNITILDEITFAPGETDLRTAIVRAREQQPEGILWGTLDDSSYTAFLKQRKELYPEAVLYTERTIETFVNSGEYDDVLYDIYYSAPSDIDETFVQRYETRWGHLPQTTTPNAYDATMIVIEAMQEGNMDAGSIRNYLNENEFNTVTFGKISFDKQGGIADGKFDIKLVSGNGIEVVSYHYDV